MSAFSAAAEPGLLTVAAFVLAAVTSTAGVSGAFLLLPLQIWVLGIVGPVVTATNLLFNLIATPGGVFRYFREGRMLWHLAWILALGSLPGMVVGYWLRVYHFSGIDRFKWIVAGVLILLGLRMLFDASLRPRGAEAIAGRPKAVGGGVLSAQRLTDGRLNFSYAGRCYAPRIWRLMALSAAVGVVGGVYGIGGGALVAPFLLWLFRLPVYAIAGGALGATFLSSLAGVLLYWGMTPPQGVSTAPDWWLGLLLGLGGLAGTYLGASLQKYVPQAVLKGLLGAVSLLAGTRFLFL